MVQGELFREEPADFSAEPEFKSFLSRTCFAVTLDKALMGLVAMVVVFVLTYSFGVERGKRAMESRMESFSPVSGGPAHADLPSQTRDPQEEVILVGESGAQESTLALSETSATKTTPKLQGTQTPLGTSLPLASAFRKGAYTVQLVTYTDEAQAAREIERLSSSGRQAFVIPSGHYFQVCVDYFSNTAEARIVMKRLGFTRRYPDAFVRPVVR